MEYLPQRKHPRLKNYDYSLPGYYYVTIHAASNDICFSHIEKQNESGKVILKLTKMGHCAYYQLYALTNRYQHVHIDKCVVMPTHIHVIIQLQGYHIVPPPRADITSILCAYKSITTRQINKIDQTPGRIIFQTSFYEEVLRNEQAYLQCWRYIDENPVNWSLNPEDI